MNKNIKKFKKRPDFVEIYGFHSVQAALKNNRRNHYNLIISKQNITFKESLKKKVKIRNRRKK